MVQRRESSIDDTRAEIGSAAGYVALLSRALSVFISGSPNAFSHDDAKTGSIQSNYRCDGRLPLPAACG